MMPFPPNPMRRRARTAAFTMVEIAMALAIIGFALVAIIGILPLGMDVQKKNRRETIINQDANLWIEALRGGNRGMDDLTNYVISITNYWYHYDANYHLTGQGIDWYTTTDSYYANQNWGLTLALTNGARIIGLLSTPQILTNSMASGTFSSNYVTAYFHSLSGAAVEKTPQANEIIKDASFGYKLVSEIVPYGARTNTAYDLSETNYLDSKLVKDVPGIFASNALWVASGRGDPYPGLTNWIPLTQLQIPTEDTRLEVTRRAHNWWLAQRLRGNLYDVCLIFRWPLLPGGKVSREGRQVYRFNVSGVIVNEMPDGNQQGQNTGPFYYFHPQVFTLN